MSYKMKDIVRLQGNGHGKRAESSGLSIRDRALAAVAGGVSAASMCFTFCTDVRGTLNTMANNYIYPIMKWGGAFFILLGIAQAAKGIMDSTSGQEQPGTMGKALGKFAIGVILVAGQTIIASISP